MKPAKPVTDPKELICLAHLANEVTPREAAELSGISLNKTMTLRRRLKEHQENNTLQALYNMDEAARNQLLETVRESTNELVPEELHDDTNQAISVIQEELSELDQLANNAQNTANILAKKIGVVATTTTNADTLHQLTLALAVIQDSFFASSPNIQVNNFESFLKD